MSELVRILMYRDDISEDEARKLISEARQRVTDGEDPEEILYEEFGLETDYILDLL